MIMDKKMEQNTAENLENTDDIEAQLLSAMSVDDIEDLPVYRAYAGESLDSPQNKANLSEVVDALKTVFDPEIPINIYDLGLIYKIDQKNNGDVHIDMTLTAPGCPVAGVLPQQVADAVALVDGIGKVDVEIVWDPAWSLERLSDEAKMMLEML